MGGLEIELGEESLIKTLITLVECGICGHHYEVDNVSVLGSSHDSWCLKAHCSVWHTQSLVAVVITRDGMSENVTDLTRTECGKFRGAGVLLPDDVLDMHNFLKDFGGDVSQLFNKE